MVVANKPYFVKKVGGMQCVFRKGSDEVEFSSVNTIDSLVCCDVANEAHRKALSASRHLLAAAIKAEKIVGSIEFPDRSVVDTHIKLKKAIAKAKGVVNGPTEIIPDHR